MIRRNIGIILLLIFVSCLFVFTLNTLNNWYEAKYDSKRTIIEKRIQDKINTLIKTTLRTSKYEVLITIDSETTIDNRESIKQKPDTINTIERTFVETQKEISGKKPSIQKVSNQLKSSPGFENVIRDTRLSKIKEEARLITNDKELESVSTEKKRETIYLNQDKSLRTTERLSIQNIIIFIMIDRSTLGRSNESIESLKELITQSLGKNYSIDITIKETEFFDSSPYHLPILILVSSLLALYVLYILIKWFINRPKKVIEEINEVLEERDNQVDIKNDILALAQSDINKFNTVVRSILHRSESVFEKEDEND